MQQIQNDIGLFVAIVQSSLNQTDRGPIIFEAKIWDGRQIKACDVEQEECDLQGSCSEGKIRAFAEGVKSCISLLIGQGKAFTVETIYCNGQRRKLEWTISLAPKAVQQ